MPEYIYDLKVIQVLGEKNYEKLRNAVDANVIGKSKMYDFARALGPKVGGGHARRMENGAKCDFSEIKEILSDWYGDELCYKSQLEGLEILDRVFRDCLRIPNPISDYTVKRRDSPYPTQRQTPRTASGTSCSESESESEEEDSNTGDWRSRRRIRTRVRSGNKTYTKKKTISRSSSRSQFNSESEIEIEIDPSPSHEESDNETNTFNTELYTALSDITSAATVTDETKEPQVQSCCCLL